VSYFELIQRVSRLHPPWYVFGGVAEDAVLDASLRSPHADLDVLVSRNELSERMVQAESVGFGSLSTYYEPLPGLPLVVGGSSGGLGLEFGIADRDAAGYFFIAGSSDGRLHRIDVTDELFGHPPIVIEGVKLHVVSPLALYQMRDAFMRLGTFGPPRDKDVARQSRLRDLLRDVDGWRLEARVTPLR
jgi:hypothetical protein